MSQTVAIELPRELSALFAARLAKSGNTMQDDILNLIHLGLEAERQSRPDHVRVTIQDAVIQED